MRTYPHTPPRPRSTRRLAISLAQSVALLAVILYATASAGQFQVAWDQHPDATVTGFRIYRIDGPAKILLASPATSPTTIEANPGDIIAVSAWNGVEGGLSEFVTVPAAPVPPAPPTGLRVWEIQTSTSGKNWKTLAFVPKADAAYMRVLQSTIPQP